MVEYPVTPRTDLVEDYHGTAVADPYRWLEEMQSPDVLAWVDQQNEVTAAHLDTIEIRDTIRERFRQLWNFPRRSAPMRRGDWYFYTHNDGLQAQPVLYKEHVAGGDPIAVLDPNTLSVDGTVALMTVSLTKDGSTLAYSLAEAGSDWQVAHVLNTETGEQYPDEIRHIKFTTLAWSPDEDGFYYARFPEPGESSDAAPSTNQRVYFHRLGADQFTDELVFARPEEPDHGFHPFLTDDGELLILHVWQGTDTRNRIYYRAAVGEGDFVRLLDDFDAKYEVVGHDAGVLYVLTDREAPRGRIVAIDLDQPDEWREVVPHGEATIEFASIVAGSLVVASLSDASHIVELWSLAGRRLESVDLPTLGAVTQFAGKPEHDEFFLGFESFVQPPVILRYDFTARRLEQHSPEVAGLDPAEFVTKQIWAESKDGTRIPMFVTHRADLVPNGTTPTILYGYGGFDISMVPMYAPDRLGFVESGGIFVVANLRGGGEFGQEWHQAGMFGQKQNVFDDFIAAAEHLIAEGYTSPSNLGIYGRSNGGLLVTACLWQRPDLYGAVVGMVPVTDMLRYHRFTAGRYWTAEWGNAEESADQFSFLHAYSPLHNVRPGDYPPTLITTGDTDDRVVPLHSYKFIAELQGCVGQSGPALLRVDRRAGHGLGKPIAKLIEEAADIYAFFLHHLTHVD
ncbi:MAG: prolyl oligopeptidase family serine peptidase [Acidimicrobiia bacterium]|nr:prolyl oligopeptidase family serine peptidase [Acidimicrobiia bacterium]